MPYHKKKSNSVSRKMIDKVLKSKTENQLNVYLYYETVTLNLLFSPITLLISPRPLPKQMVAAVGSTKTIYFLISDSAFSKHRGGFVKVIGNIHGKMQSSLVASKGRPVDVRTNKPFSARTRSVCRGFGRPFGPTDVKWTSSWRSRLKRFGRSLTHLLAR